MMVSTSKLVLVCFRTRTQDTYRADSNNNTALN